MTAPAIGITNHALLRWLERVHGIDVDGCRALMRAEVALAMANLDSEADRPDDAHLFILDGNFVLTCLSPGQRPKKRTAAGCVIPRVSA